MVAKNQFIAQKAANLVKVEYEDIHPVILSIEDAIEHKSFFYDPCRVIKQGDNLEQVEWYIGQVSQNIRKTYNDFKVFKEAPHVLEGQCRIGGQEHFYFETQSLIVVPKKEDDEMEIYSSTQNPTEIQVGNCQ